MSRLPGTRVSRFLLALGVGLAIPVVGILLVTVLLLTEGAIPVTWAVDAVIPCGVGLLVVLGAGRAWSSPRRRVASGLGSLTLAGGLAVAVVTAAPAGMHGLTLLFGATATDAPPARFPCGDPGPHFDRLALRAARAHFPHETVVLVHGCSRSAGDRTREVRLRIGRFLAPKRPTQLVVGERVTFDGDAGTPTLSPYPDEAAVEADLPRLDGTEAVRERLGDASRLCLLDGDYAGFTLGWWLDCEPTAELGPVAEVPAGWPEPLFARGCDGSELHASPCFQAPVARPVVGTRRVDGHRRLNDFDARSQPAGSP